MNLHDLIDKWRTSADRREQENLRREIEEVLNCEPFTSKDVVLIITSIVATSAIVLFLEKVIKAEIDRRQ